MLFKLTQPNSHQAPTCVILFRCINSIIGVAILLNSFCTHGHAEIFPPRPDIKKPVTVLFYLNGDNDLNHEVLHTVDMLETVGSSADVNILALVDGSPRSQHGYGNEWEGSRLLYITRDDHIGQINSIVLQDMGEQDLGRPETLEAFIKKGLVYSAERYIFCTFAHGRGIIDTKTYTLPGLHKSLAISIDETDGTYMTLPEFRRAIKNGLNGSKFDLMVFFSCLTGMVEVGYALRDLTEYLIGSEDEIRIVNQPPGSFQIRGIKFEEPLKSMRSNPSLSIFEFGKITINTFIDQYTRDVSLKDPSGQALTCRYQAALALIDCRALNQLAIFLNDFADYIQKRLQGSEHAKTLLREIQLALSKTQRYASFLNLEYYDVQDFLMNLEAETADMTLKALCAEIIAFLRQKVIKYERHTPGSSSNGLSIFLSNYLIPENIFQTHQKLYRDSAFSRETGWDEMIEAIRRHSLAGRNTF